ncbi:MAG: transposase [Alphaproteobacteria bacterium]|nr:transposase [Alphaproteobacteria bacterium]
MQETSKYFRHDELLRVVRVEFEKGLKRQKSPEVKGSLFSNVDCLMSGLALFTFKFPSLLQFDEATREEGVLGKNIKTLFELNHSAPSDTYMRERLDAIDFAVSRTAFTKIFGLLQRSHLLDHFQFMGRYLISLDGTGVFSSSSVHCSNCCVKEHRNGSKTYYHQILGAALVHPDQKVVYPLAPEPIMKEDGNQKNDCERNATKRWVQDFKREHPHLKATILADGLACNEPLIRLLRENNLSYILVCKEGDHTYLKDWIEALGPEDMVQKQTVSSKGTYAYSLMKDVPLKDGPNTLRTTVVSFQETTPTSTRKWLWVTDLDVTLANVEEFTKGARSRWKIENETFNTLKNQGYQFEHNFGHGNKYLHRVLTSLMMLAFFIDQCLQSVNKRFQAALERLGRKRALWDRMRNSIFHWILPDFETLYHLIAHPPPATNVPSILGA